MFNNQFKGPNAWADYFTSLEQATPFIRAISVTDYYCTDTYQQVVWEMRDNNRLPQVALVFPNAELRLDVATVKERWTNVHLLVSQPVVLIEELRRVVENAKKDAKKLFCPNLLQRAHLQH